MPDAAPRPGCRRLTDFDESDRNSDWFVVNDGVMGGRSDGRVDFDGSTMVFDGTVVTAGGGFTSVRLRLFGDELVGSERLDVRLRADDRTYGITLEDTGRTGRRAVAHRADFDIPAGDADGWSVASLDYTELQPSVFGQPIDVAAFDPGQAVEIGLIIADGIDGGFAVTVDWVDACA